MPLPTVAYPTLSTELPSTKKKIEYRPMLVGEEKIVLMAMENKKVDPVKIVDSIAAVLRAVTFEKLNIAKLATVDIEWLLLKLRICSKGETTTLTFNCLKNLTDDAGNEVLIDGMPQACGKSKVVKFDLTKVEATPGPTTNKIMFNDKVGMTLSFPAYDLTKRLTEQITSKNKSLADMTEMVIYECIENIFDGDEVSSKKDFTLEEFTDFYNKLPITGKEQIQDYFNSLPKLSAVVAYECACGKYKDEITVEGLESFLD
jgi:hypothetical protein